jgi:starch synthase
VSQPLQIVMVASEAVPFAKAGGLGDVAGVLPSHLVAMGHDVRLIMPLYGTIDRSRYALRPVLDSMGVPMGSGTEWCRVLEHRSPDGFTVHFIEHHEAFSHGGIYDEYGFWHNGRRFVFFSRAALQVCMDTGYKPDVIHCHDWMTAILPAYLKSQMSLDPLLGYSGTVLTLHNVGDGYQGKCHPSTFEFSGLSQSLFNVDQFEDNGWMNLLKGGLAQADLINAVSPTFAREIQTKEGGCGLDFYVRRRAHDLHGILNGVDDRAWNPETDRLIPANYSVDDMAGKAICKRELQKTFGMHQDENAPLFGVVSRMSEQKGLNTVVAALPAIIERGGQFVLVGSGDPNLEWRFQEIAGRYHGRVGTYIGFNNPLAHLVEAGADFFLMPSLWEPCGLNQLYSLRYGTLPVVRATGGLEDTVENYQPETGEGTGFKFQDPSGAALAGTAIWAINTYHQRRDHIHKMQQKGMRLRFEWSHAAQRYEELYRWAMAKRQHWR